MKRNISEELPARKFAPATDNSSPDDSKKEKSGQSDPAKKAKQAVYDIRYRARREDIPLLQAFSQYMQNSSLGEQDRAMIKAKLFGKEGGGMKAEDFRPLFMEAASDSISNALYKVFVKESNQEQEQIQLTYVEELQSTKDRKYQVKVTDKNSGKTYVRLATREKISQLRLNPNISEVEIISIDPDVKTGYGSPYEGERKKGEQTAAVTSGKGLKDYDGDGKVESGAKEYRGVVHNAIQRKKGGTPDGKDTSSVKEDYLYEAGKKKEKPKKYDVKYDVMKPGKKNKITIGAKEGGSPDGGIINAHTELQGTVIVETGYSKFLKIVSSGKGEKEKLNPAKVDMDGPQVGCDDPDPRSMKTASNLVKTKLRLMGLRPLMMSNEPEGEQIDEVLGGVPGDGYIGHPNLDIKNPFAKTQKKEKVLPKAPPAGAPGSGGLLNRTAAQMGDRNTELQKLLQQSYEPEGEQIDEKCWKGYKKKGMKTMFGKRYPNCVKEEEVLVDEGKKDACYHKVKSRYSVWPSAYASGALVKCRNVGAANWGNKSESINLKSYDSLSEASGESRYCPKCEKNETRNECSYGVKYWDKFSLPPSVSEAKVKRWWDDDGDGIGYEEGEVKKSKKKKTRKEEYSNWRESLDEDWQKVNKGDKTDGMSPAAVKAYRSENPGSKLKTAVTGDPKPGSKDAKRRKSFCARSKGQQDMHNIDCSSTPDKPVCKARRRWKC